MKCCMFHAQDFKSHHGSFSGYDERIVWTSWNQRESTGYLELPGDDLVNHDSVCPPVQHEVSIK